MITPCTPCFVHESLTENSSLHGTHYTPDDADIAAAAAYFNVSDKASFKAGIAALQRLWEKCVQLTGNHAC